MMSRRERAALDRYITGNYGEDQFKGDEKVRVRLRPFEEDEGEGEQYGELLSYEDGVFAVQLDDEYRDSGEDDGLRECDVAQVELLSPPRLGARPEVIVDEFYHDLRSLVRRYFPTYPTDQRGMDLLQAITEDPRACIVQGHNSTIPFIWEKLP